MSDAISVQNSLSCVMMYRWILQYHYNDLFNDEWLWGTLEATI